MERIVDIGSHQYVLGLEWIRINTGEPALQAKVFAKAKNVIYGLPRTVLSDDDSAPIHQVGLTTLKIKGHVFSGAAQLSLIHNSCIAVSQIEDDLFWLCVCDNGRVIPGRDVLLSNAELRQAYSEFVQEHETSHMRIIMTAEVASSLNMSGNMLRTDPLDLLSDVNPDSGLELRNIRGRTSTFYLGFALVAVCVAGGGLFQYESWKKEQEYQAMLAAQALEEERARAEALIKAGPSDEELLAKAKVEEIHWLQDDFNATTTVGALRAVFLVSNNLPFKIKGWTLSKLMYDRSTPNRMASVWVRSGGTIQDITQSFGPGTHVSVSANVETAVVTHDIEVDVPGIEDVLDYLGTSGTRNQDFTDTLIYRRMAFNTQLLKGFERKEPIAGLRDKLRVTEPQLIMKQRQYEITGSSAPELIKLMQIVDGVSNFYPVSLEINRGADKFEWKFVGKLIEL
ncbi:hypothetical protein ACYPKM_02795 [Pseudomonas aeruginosa]